MFTKLHKLPDRRSVDPVARTRGDNLGSMTTEPRRVTAELTQAELGRLWGQMLWRQQITGWAL